MKEITMNPTKTETNQILPAYVTPEYLATLRLRFGRGSGAPGDRSAIQEVRAWLDLDTKVMEIPPRVCPAIGALVDCPREEWRKQIARLLPKIVDTRGTNALTLRRAQFCAYWACREVAPVALRALRALADGASAALCGLAPIIDEASAKAAVESMKAAADLANAIVYARASASTVATDDYITIAARSAAEHAVFAAYLASNAVSDAPSPVALLHELLTMRER